ncbi:Cytochrome P450 monooxygenase PikC [Paraconexibacter sp. AEG42_29]|uniref:Cytochrome P450 monooxygenase PikC n=1 Tax=Paraconexibacter sp. AEG42_29 TaxID=2997339 RepID=A0AAU7APC6_9ACTN
MLPADASPTAGSPPPDVMAAAAGLMSPEHIADPYPTYARLRELDPVLFLPPLNAWLVTRFDDVKAVFKDDRLGVAFEQYQINRQGPGVTGEDYFRVGSHLLVCNDPPVHTRLRRVFRQPFTPARVQDLATVVERLCLDQLELLRPQGRADVSADFAALIPLATIGALLDVPLADQPQIGRWVYDFAPVLEVSPMDAGTLERVNAAAAGLEGYFKELVAERRAKPGEDFISAVVQANDADESPMSEAELVNNISLLYFAGQDTQKYMFTNIVAALDAQPDAYARLLEDPSRVPDAMRELYRFDSAGQFMGRTAIEDVELDGRTIKTGQTVMVCMAAANRDPSKFPEPDVLRFDREARTDMDAHITFGAGRHRCLGMHLAQLQLPIMLRTFIDVLGRVTVDREAAVRHPSIATRGFDELPVTWFA